MAKRLPDGFEAWAEAEGIDDVSTFGIGDVMRAWRAATERAAGIAEAAERRHLDCPPSCRCNDGFHIAARIRN